MHMLVFALNNVGFLSASNINRCFKVIDIVKDKLTNPYNVVYFVFDVLPLQWSKIQKVMYYKEQIVRIVEKSYCHIYDCFNILV